MVVLLDHYFEFDVPRRIQPVGPQHVEWRDHTEWGEGTVPALASPLEPLLRASLVVTDGAGHHQRSVQVVFTSKVTGEDVTSLLGTDISGFLHLALEAQTGNPLTGVRFRLALEPPATASAVALHQVVSWWEALRPGWMLGLWMSERGVWGVGPEPIGHEPPEVAPGYSEALRKAARISQRCGETIEIPAQMRAEDIKEIEVADQLVRGDVVRGRWRDAAVNDDPQLAEYLLGSEHGVLLEFRSPYIAQIAGAAITLGEAEYQFMQATVKDHDPEAGTILLKPGPNEEFQVRLVAVPERTNSDGSTAWIPTAMTEPYRGRWVAQSGTKILRSGGSFKEVAAAVRASGRLATVWRVPESREEADLLLPLGL